MFILDFFRDFFSGFMYWLYVALLVFAFFYVLGIVADRKRLAIANKLKEKKTYDIESGREAAIAAMESKQVLDVEESLSGAPNAEAAQNPNVPAEQTVPEVNNGQTKEEVPAVMVLNSSETPAEDNKPKQEEPVVISSTPTITPVQNTNNQ